MVKLVNELSYIAGVFDARGFVRYSYGKNYAYAISFNFTESDKEIWVNIKKILDKFVISKIYNAKREKGKKEYQLYVSGKKQVFNFLKLILPYTQRKREVALYLKLLETKGYKGVLK